MTKTFTSKTLTALARKGITVLAPVAVPANPAAALPFANLTAAFAVNQRGTGRVLTFREILALAGAK